ncbi:MAG: MFS transporter, partial [Betaproteobacteria bacterium]|nr:MFS transporter [Betaproteobacteria bacterium]
MGSTQTLAWASSYYLPAVLAAPVAKELETGEPFFFLCFSAALLIAALVGPRAGRWIDQRGGRVVLPITNLMFAAGLTMLALAQGPIGLMLAWLVLGVAMGYGLYDAAFAALVFLYGLKARGAITGITLIAGFASTVGWPLTTIMLGAWGWRGAILGWAALHLSLGLLLNRMIPAHPPAQAFSDATGNQELSDPSFVEAKHSPPLSPDAKGSADPKAAALDRTQVLPSNAIALLVFAFAATG